MLMPPTWVRERPRGMMRIAQFKLPRAAGDSADASLTVIVAGGSVDANIKRWEGQFQAGVKATRSASKVNGLDVMTATLEGTFMKKARPMAPGPGQAHPGYTVHAAIVKTARGQLFFKAVGPKATVAKHIPAFNQMVAGLSMLKGGVKAAPKMPGRPALPPARPARPVTPPASR